MLYNLTTMTQIYCRLCTNFMPIYYKFMPNIYTTKPNRAPTSRTTDPTLWFSSIFYRPRTNFNVFYFLCCSYIRDIIISYRLDPFVFEYLNISLLVSSPPPPPFFMLTVTVHTIIKSFGRILEE